MMKTTFDRKDNEILELEAFTKKMRNNVKKKRFYADAVRALLVFMKGFSINQTEIGSEQFAKQMDELSEMLSDEKDVKDQELAFEKYKKGIPDFIKRQKDYLKKREKEIWDIIELQRTAIAALDSDNQDYNRKVYEQSEKIEAITLLDDIKTIKKKLKKEVETIQETLRTKQEQDKARMEALSKQIDILNLELKKAQAKGMIDDLTQAYNRGAFDQYIRRVVDQNAIKPTPFSLMMLDVDDFKDINDLYGHQIGDRVLVALVRRSRDFIREEDFLARYGGEEFAIILPGASLKNAVKKARRLRKAVADTQYIRDKEKKGKGISITISIGVSSFGKGDSVSAIIGRADRALYQAKKNGKNRVFSETDLVPGSLTDFPVNADTTPESNVH